MKKITIFLCTISLTMLSTVGAKEDAIKDLANRNTAFAIDLYEELKAEEGNIFFSPYSISTALAMTHVGARDITEKEMNKVFHFPLNRKELNSSFSTLQKKLNKIQDKKHVTLGIANSLWGDKNYKFHDVFLDTNLNIYDAKIRNLDFRGAPQKSRKIINRWVEDKTKEKIKELLKPPMITPDTVLVLCNAIYFKGNWAAQFDKKVTRERDFFVEPDKPIRTQLMFVKTKIRSKTFDSLQVFELPYEGNDISMVILLPKEKDGLNKVETKLTIPNINEWLKGIDEARPVKSMVWFPKFKTTCEFELSRTLKKMGMPSAFSGSADFSGMTGGENGLFISVVAHKAFVDVNEEGTEAAAATGVVMTKSAGPRLPVFNVDHPFIFIIKEKSTGSILFMGRIKNPK